MASVIKLSVVERKVIMRRMTVLQIVTAEIQTVIVAHFQSKIQLSGFSAYPDSSASQLIRIIGVLQQ